MNRDPSREPRFCECGDHAFVWLTLGQVALFDPEDAPKIAGRRWSACWRKGATIHAIGQSLAHSSPFMSRVVMNAPEGMIVDHINHDTLDNRKRKLRVCNAAQSKWNCGSYRGRSRYKGVHWQKGRWTANIAVNRRRFSLGRFDTEEEAAAAYDEAALIHHGEYALTNARMLGNALEGPGGETPARGKDRDAA